MRIVVMDMRTKRKETFNFATAKPGTGSIAVTDKRGNEHYFPTIGTIVMSSQDPGGFSGLLLRIASRR